MTFTSAAVNERADDRLVLVVEVWRDIEVNSPLPQLARLANKLALGIYRLHPVFRATHRSLRAVCWEPSHRILQRRPL